MLFNIRENDYDLVICPFPGRLNSIYYSLCKGIKKAGFINFRKIINWDDKDWNLNLNGHKTEIVLKASDNFLDRVEVCLTALGIKVNNPLSKLTFPILDEKITDHNFPKYVLCHFKSKIRTKSLNLEICTKIIGDLLKKGFSVKVIDQPILKNYLEEKNVEVIEISSLKVLVNLVQNCSFYVGIDSFPLHLADAYKKLIFCFLNTDNINSILSSENIKYKIDMKQNNPLILQQFKEELKKVIH
ncbi:hypothetical protein BH10BAC5_BH10BAC5_14530 [soil metagenome]